MAAYFVGRGRRFLGGGKALAVAALVLLLVWACIPWAWGPPTVEISVPESWPADGPGRLTVRVKAAHPNFVVRQVFVIFDKPTSAPEAGNWVEVVGLQESGERAEWTRSSLRRFAGPHTEQLSLEVPLGQLRRRQWTGAGSLSGRIAVDVAYPVVRGARLLPGQPFFTRPQSVRLPFTVTLTD